MLRLKQLSRLGGQSDMRGRSLVAICGFLVALSGIAVAENPYIARVSLGAKAFRVEASAAALVGRKFKPITINIREIFGVGSFQAVLNRRKLPSAEAYIVRQGKRTKDSRVPVLFKGFLLGRVPGEENRERRPVAVSIIDGLVQLQFRGPVKSHRNGAARVYTVRWKLGDRNIVSARVSSIPSSAFANKVCAAGVAHPAEKKVAREERAVMARASETYRVLTISTDADPEWYARYGDQSNAEIAAIVNTAEAIYERQLGMRFALARQHVYADAAPYASTDASTLLASFAKNPENPANLTYSSITFDDDVDLKHLFTGKDLNGNTVGLAYVGSVCWAPKSAYGLTQNIRRDFNVAIFSHELGHSLGAQHDTTDPRGLMYPSLQLQARFSKVSIDQINTFLRFSGKCIAEQTLRPNLSNAKLTLKSKPNKSRTSLLLYGTLLSASQKPIGGEVVKLTINDKEVLVTTDEAGVFSYTLKTSRGKDRKVFVSAQIVGSETAIPAAPKITTKM